MKTGIAGMPDPAKAALLHPVRGVSGMARLMHLLG
jgi:hypothetical protein